MGLERWISSERHLGLLQKDPGLVPSTRMAAHNRLHSSFILFCSPPMWCIDIHAGNIHIHKSKQNILKELITFLFPIRSQKLFSKTQVEENQLVFTRRLQFYHYETNTLYLSCLFGPKLIYLLILHHKSKFFYYAGCCLESQGTCEHVKQRLIQLHLFWRSHSSHLLREPLQDRHAMLPPKRHRRTFRRARRFKANGSRHLVCNLPCIFGVLDSCFKGTKYFY